MTSDETRRGTDRPWREVGLGAVPRFRCAACDRASDTTGRRLKRVNGLRTWVCRKCAEATS